jgi:crotonobetainyl-CoA:carnitine CoA-transferase CaiB-like acyl-CoA transferase
VTYEEEPIWPSASPRLDFLAGRRVVELSTRASAAYAGRLLALFGADVTRVDLPVAYDCRAAELPHVVSALAEYKRTIAVADESAIADVLGGCDLVLTDSGRDDAADGAVVDLVTAYLVLTPPQAHVIECPSHVDGSAASSLTACAEGGMSWAIGEPTDSPLTLPFDLSDYLAGTEMAASAALALLTSDECPAQRWSVPVADVIAYYVGQISSNFVPYERPWHRDGARATMSGGSYPAAMFPCKDGWMSVMCRTQPEWHGLVAALGRPEWLDDPRYRDSRVVARLHADELDPIVAQWCRALTREEVFAAGRLHGFPVAPVLTVNEAMAEEQFKHRSFFIRNSSGLLAAGSPYRVTDSPTSRHRSRPATRLRSRTRPLDGLRVLDLAWVWSGPMVTASLADLGAEVIKVESRMRPDPSRLRGRAYRDGQPLPGPELEVTPYHNQMNRGKRSVDVDITTEEGAALVRRLAGKCDVVVENMRPGVLARRNLDYETLSKDHPELVMVSLSMLGQTGPLSGIRGYAVVMSGLAGLDSIIGYGPDRLIGTFNPALGDPNGAAHGLAVLLAALHRAQRHGQGAWIDVSQVEALLSLLRAPIVRAQTNGGVAPPGNRHSTWWPHGIYQAAGNDEWIALACRTDAERSRLAQWCGQEAYDGPRLEAALSAALAITSAERAVGELAARGLPAASVASYQRLTDGTREVFDAVSHPWLGEQSLFGLDWRHDGQRLRVERPAPLLGADTTAVLHEVLGIAEGEIADLRRRGVIGSDS